MGETYREIAEALGVSHQAISATCNTPEVEQQIEDLNAAAYKLVHEQRGRLITKAVQTLDLLMDSDNERVAKAAASDLLDRLGVEKGRRLTVDGDRTISDEDAVEELRDLVATEPQGDQE